MNMYILVILMSLLSGHVYPADRGMSSARRTLSRTMSNPDDESSHVAEAAVPSDDETTAAARDVTSSRDTDSRDSAISLGSYRSSPEPLEGLLERHKTITSRRALYFKEHFVPALALEEPAERKKKIVEIVRAISALTENINRALASASERIPADSAIDEDALRHARGSFAVATRNLLIGSFAYTDPKTKAVRVLPDFGDLRSIPDFVQATLKLFIAYQDNFFSPCKEHFLANEALAPLYTAYEEIMGQNAAGEPVAITDPNNYVVRDLGDVVSVRAVPNMYLHNIRSKGSLTTISQAEIYNNVIFLLEYLQYFATEIKSLAVEISKY